MTKERSERIDKGMNIYDRFTKKFNRKVLTPNTYSLELFAILKQYKQEDLLLREMMNEYVTNFVDIEVFNIGDKLFYKETTEKVLGFANPENL